MSREYDHTWKALLNHHLRNPLAEVEKVGKGSVSGIPKITLRLDSLLELTGVKKAVILRLAIYYSFLLQIKISERKQSIV